MTTKVRHGMVVSTWIVSAVLTAVTVAVVPQQILWLLGATTTTTHFKCM